MYKLFMIAGPQRGTRYPLKEGVTTLGRQPGNDIVLPSAQVSKKHCLFKLQDGNLTVEDLKSANGTFVNGLMVQVKQLLPKDRVSMGEFVLEVVASVKSSALVPLMKMGPGLDFSDNLGNLKTGRNADSLGELNSSSVNEPPKEILKKLIWYFENELMTFFYRLNFKNEWKSICLFLFFLFIFSNLIISVYPVLELNRKNLVQEIGRRAQFMAREIADKNSGFLSKKDESQTDIGNIEYAQGIKEAVLIDMDLRVLAPRIKSQQYLTNPKEALLAVKVSQFFREGRETGVIFENDDRIISIEPVKVFNQLLGKNQVIAMAVVSLDTSLSTPDLGQMGVMYSEAFILTFIIGIIILIIIYKITLKPFHVLNEDLDKVLKGEISQVTHEFKWEELNSLWDIINAAIQRISKQEIGSSQSLQGMDSQGFSDSSLAPLRMIGNLVQVGMVVFDSQQKILYMNSLFEEMSGIRSDASLGQEMSAVARDQSLGVFVSDLLTRAPLGSEGVSEDYDFSGLPHRVYVAAFGVLGQTAQGYLLIAFKSNS